MSSDTQTVVSAILTEASFPFDHNYLTFNIESMKKLILALLFVSCSASAQLNPPSQPHTTVATVRNAYASTNVGTSAWVQLVAALSGSVTQVDIFDSSGQTLELGVGPSGSETVKGYVIPGGNGSTPISYSQGDRVSIKALSGTASIGEIDLNMFR